MLFRAHIVLTVVCIFHFAIRPAIAATPAFSDQTAAAGITAVHIPNGVNAWTAGGCVADFNNDGWQDIYFCGGGSAFDSLLINNGDGTFTNQAAAWGMQTLRPGTAAIAGDYDGDGRIDLVLTSDGPGGSSLHRLYRNMPGNTFSHVTIGSGLIVVDEQGTPTSTRGWGGAFGDYDLDGNLDLAVNCYITRKHTLYRNLGNGTFVDQSQAALGGPPFTFFGFTPRFIDMDGDRYPELLWVSDLHTGIYYVNNGDGTFTDATESSHTMVGSTEMGSTAADFDHNGLFDFYVTTIGFNQLYMNQGSHVFTSRAYDAGVDDTGFGWGTVSPDINHDGWPDLIATGYSGQFAFLNQTADSADISFEDVSLTIGIRGVGIDNGRGLANFDYDNDGDQDILVFQHNGPLKLYRNDLTGNGDTHWLRVFLDTNAAPDIAPNGIGSVVNVTTGGFTQTGRIDGGSNYLSQSEMSAHFGLGTATVVDELRVEWTNGDVTFLNNVAADQTMTIAASNTLLYGDMNCDGNVDIADAPHFADAILDRAKYAMSHFGCNALAADYDGNDIIDGRDIAMFVQAMLN